MLTLLELLHLEVATINRATTAIPPVGQLLAGNADALTFPTLSSIIAAIDADATTPQGGKRRDCRNCGPPPGHDV